MIAEKLALVRARIEGAAERVGRDPSDVVLVAITKKQPSELVVEAVAAGQKDMGESRAQDLVRRLVDAPSGIRWHFVGALQRNKVRHVRPAVEMLHSLDRLSLAAAWLKGPGLPPPVLVEVNVGCEPQKGGALRQDVPELVAGAVDMGVDVRGLMAIPPITTDPEEARSVFRSLRMLRDELRESCPRVAELSMGMSNDYTIAVEEGATLVRVGEAIFGPRGE